MESLLLRKQVQRNYIGMSLETYETLRRDFVTNGTPGIAPYLKTMQPKAFVAVYLALKQCASYEADVQAGEEETNFPSYQLFCYKIDDLILLVDSLIDI